MTKLFTSHIAYAPVIVDSGNAVLPYRIAPVAR